MGPSRKPVGAVALAALVALAGCHDPELPAYKEPPVESPAELVNALAAAYDSRQPEAVAALLSDRADAPYLFVVGRDQSVEFPVTFCDRATELSFHWRLLQPESLPATEPPVPSQLRATALHATFAPRSAWTEHTDLYAAPGGQAGLDSTRWRALGADYDLRLRLDFPANIVYEAHAFAGFVVLEDRTLEPHARDRFFLYRWTDSGPFSAGAAAPAANVGVPRVTWTVLHSWYLPTIGVTSETMLMLEYQDAYQRRNPGKLAALLAQDSTAAFRFLLASPSPEGAMEWAAADEIHLHRRMFQPAYLPPGDPPVPTSLWVQSIQAAFIAREPFVERPDVYADPPARPAGLDPAVWRASTAVYDIRLLVAVSAGNGYLVEERVRCTVIENRTKHAGEAGKFCLYRLEELADAVEWSRTPVGKEPVTWGTLKGFYRVLRLDSEAGFVGAFVDAYRRRDTVAFDGLLSRDPGAEYRFTAPGRGPGGTDAGWDAAEESRLQRRMFAPDLLGPGETPVPWQLRLQRAEVYLRAQDRWLERADLYRSDSNPDGLDPARWRATSASFTVAAAFKSVLLHTHRVAGDTDFVVIEDRTKSAPVAGKYLLYRWVDRTQLSDPAGDPPDTTTVSWTAFKRFYD